jgi:hypothetical protein
MLVHCPTCRRAISSAATTCPSCGEPDAGERGRSVDEVAREIALNNERIREQSRLAQEYDSEKGLAAARKSNDKFFWWLFTPSSLLVIGALGNRPGILVPVIAVLAFVLWGATH